MPKVITLKQPWAQLVVQGHKQMETRGFKTSHRGELYIHSSAHFNSEFIDLCYTEPFNRCIESPHYLKCGYIIGKVDLMDCFPTEAVRDMMKGGTPGDRELAFGDYSDGRYAWLLARPVMFKKPIFQKGSLSLWNYPYLIEETL